jgi:anaerobic selenocysteine-containing dehydrogenase
MMQMTDRINDIWGSRTPYGSGQTWPVRVDQFLADNLSEADVDAWVQSACILCSTGCGCDSAVKDGRMVGVRGRETHVVSAIDAATIGVQDGELCAVSSEHGHAELRARIKEIQPGVVFAPFHYGSLTREGLDVAHASTDGQRPTAANEVTQTEIDPVSKQPVYKRAAVRVARIT